MIVDCWNHTQRLRVSIGGDIRLSRILNAYQKHLLAEQILYRENRKCSSQWQSSSCTIVTWCDRLSRKNEGSPSNLHFCFRMNFVWFHPFCVLLRRFQWIVNTMNKMANRPVFVTLNEKLQSNLNGEYQRYVFDSISAFGSMEYLPTGNHLTNALKQFSDDEPYGSTCNSI